jgi:hypothetical protein
MQFLSLAITVFNGKVGAAAPPAGSTYLRTDGTSYFNRPDGSSVYNRP